MEIKFTNRETGLLEVEKVYGEKMVEWLYGSQVGNAISAILIRPWLSQLYGWWQDTPFSKKKVNSFIKKFDINMTEYETQSENSTDLFESFNQFFIRKFKKGARPFDSRENVFCAPCEARYFGYDSVKESELIPVKGKWLLPEMVVSNEKWNETFKGGPMVLARLCPVDYHRYHYPDDGEVLDYYPVKGDLHSVNPLALKNCPDIFARNERRVTILETKNFGKLAYVEVGAICVGKIVQSNFNESFKRGEEKGYFLFGGSTVIVYGEEGKWTPDQDILENTKNGVETYIKIGKGIGSKV